MRQVSPEAERHRNMISSHVSRMTSLPEKFQDSGNLKVFSPAKVRGIRVRYEETCGSSLPY
jgi:hypothetical protein